MKPLVAVNAEPRIKKSNYPEPFASRMEGRLKRPLGDLFGLSNFGVNLTTLEPGAQSALLHRHSKQDEFVFVLEGELVLVTDKNEVMLEPGMCSGFPAAGVAHYLVNRSTRRATYLEVGDRRPGDHVDYPQDDLIAELENGEWAFTHRDGTPY